MNEVSKDTLNYYGFMLDDLWSEAYDQFSPEDQNLLEEYFDELDTLKGTLLDASNISDKNVYLEDLYILPRTYLTNDHQNPIIIFQPSNSVEPDLKYEPIEFEVTDEFLQTFHQNLENSKNITKDEDDLEH